MNKLGEPNFTTRQTVTVELPLNKHTRILRPEQVMLKIGSKYCDIGALCYALRSVSARKPSQPREVVTGSILKQRQKHILQLIRALSSLIADGGKAKDTAFNYAVNLVRFADFCDARGLVDSLGGGESTRDAFRAWANELSELYRRQDISASQHNFKLQHVGELLKAATDLDDVMYGFSKVKERTNPNGGTEPLAINDFAHAVALNQCIFDGLCDLILEPRPFPYKLRLPATLGWAENHLWLFPTTIWRLPPHLRNDRMRLQWGSNSSWCYDYQNGRLSTVDETEHRYSGHSRSIRRESAKKAIRKAKARLDKANADRFDTWRFSLGMHAMRSFLFLFICNTGGNEQVVLELETDGTIDASVENQNFRGIKWRAAGKEVKLVAPVTFIARLRRFMELRNYLLKGRRTPYLFFSCGKRNNRPPEKLIGSSSLDLLYRNLLLEIDPKLPRIGSRALRASVDDYYLRFHGSVVAAAVMGHTVETEERKYARGSTNEHYEDMTIFMAAVADSARRQRVIPLNDATPEFSPLEQGGRCDSFGHPEPLAAHAPVPPNCKDSQGCLFCNHRVLIAGEEDVRKVASAAYVMEQLILGPKHEEALRPSIAKCDEDLEKIAAYLNCRAMVESVRNDVYDNQNLTPFWADKYLIFLELGIIS